MTAAIPAAPILGMYETNGAFPTPGPSAWPSGPTTNLSATYMAWGQDVPTYVETFVAECNSNGLVPYVELEPWNSGASWDEDVEFSTITGGTWDSWLESIGTYIASTGKVCILTHAHEFNVSGQYPWSQGDTGDGPSGGAVTPAEWITCWEYVRNKINSTANGYALWMWACSAWTAGTTIDPTPYWPGAEYVDMVGIDGYPSTEYGQSLGTFSGQIQQTVTAIRDFGWSGPIFISETNLAQMAEGGTDSSVSPPVTFGPGQDITSFVADMYAAGCSGILEFEDASWDLPQMTAAQWTEYNDAVAANFTGGGGGTTPPPSGGGGTLTVTPGTPDEVSASDGVAQSVTPVSPAAGEMVRWEVAWLNSNDTLGLTFTAQDSAGTSYGAPTLTGTPGDGDGGCYLLVWDRVYETAPGALTLTVTASGSGVSAAAPSDCLILPYVISGQAADQSSAAFNNFSEAGTSTNTYEIALATTAAGSVVFVLGAPNHNDGETGPVVPLASTVTDVDWDDANVGSRGTFGRSASPTVTPGSTTFGWTSVNPSPNGYGVMAAEVIPAAASVSGGGTFTPVGSWIETTGVTFTWQPADEKNVLVVIAMSETAGEPVTALASSNAAWAEIVPDQTLGSATVTEVTAFLGTASGTGSATVTLTTTAASGNLRVVAHEFDPAGQAVTLDTFAVMNADATGEVTAWPPVVPATAGELLVGYERNFGDGADTAVAGSTANVSYYVDDNDNGAAFDTNVSASTAVGWDDTDSRTVLVLLLAAGAGGAQAGASSGLLMVGIA